MISILVERASEDGLSREQWSFSQVDRDNGVWIVLTDYRKETRPSKRHKFRLDDRAHYNRYSNNMYSCLLSESEVPAPDDVLKEALQVYVSKVRVGLWQQLLSSPDKVPTLA